MGLIRPQKYVGNTGFGNIPSRSRRRLSAVTPEEVGRRSVGAIAISVMSFMSWILLMTNSGELAGVLGVNQGLRPDGMSSIG